MLSVDELKAGLAKCLKENDQALERHQLTLDEWENNAATLGTFFNIAQGLTSEVIQDSIVEPGNAGILNAYFDVCEDLIKSYKKVATINVSK